MPAYAIGVYDIWNADWRDEYRPKTIALVAKHGGRFLVRPNCRVTLLEGKPSIKTGMVVIEFPSRHAALAWYDDPDYQPLKKMRQTGSQLDFVLVDGLET